MRFLKLVEMEIKVCPCNLRKLAMWHIQHKDFMLAFMHIPRLFRQILSHLRLNTCELQFDKTLCVHATTH